jgi:hypothetical protein
MRGFSIVSTEFAPKARLEALQNALLVKGVR